MCNAICLLRDLHILIVFRSPKKQFSRFNCWRLVTRVLVIIVAKEFHKAVCALIADFIEGYINAFDVGKQISHDVRDALERESVVLDAEQMRLEISHGFGQRLCVLIAYGVVAVEVHT